MKLEQILQGDQALLYMERYVDEGTRTYSPFATKSEVAQEFQPRSNFPSFELINVTVPRSQVEILHADPPQALRDLYVRADEVRFLVHPEAWESAEIERLKDLHALRLGEPVTVAPTASTRTVFATESLGNAPAHFIKLHYPRRISRFNRRLRRLNIRNSVAVAQDLANVEFEKFAYLPDTLGFIYGNGPKAWGFLVREKVPRPFQGTRFMVPFFALYGGDLQEPQDPPLLVQWIDLLGADPQSFVVDEIMIPLLECWAKVVRERGILLESHGQNTLIEIDQDFRPCRVVHRDFDVWVDAEVRKKAGLGFMAASIGDHAAYPPEQHYSLVFDHFIGRELFDYLLKVLTSHYGVKEQAIRARVAEAFHQSFPDSDCFFPHRTTFYFSNEVLPGNDYKLVDTHRTPEWR